MAQERIAIARLTRVPLLREEEDALQRIHAAEQARRPTRLGQPKLEVLADRGLIYVVRFPPPKLPFAHVTGAGAVLLGVERGNRR
jgi:hypothetical protein